MSKLSFEMALANMKRGKMVRRASEPGIAYRLEGNYFSVWKPARDCLVSDCWDFSGMFRFFSDVDILAEDWEVVE